MKKVVSIFLFFCIVVPSVTTYSWLQYKKYQVKKHVKHQILAGLDQSALVLLKFTNNESSELRWEHDQEFEYNGQMYDVVNSIEKRDSIYYWCWRDHEETKLINQLKIVVANALGNDQQNKENQNRLLDFFKILYFSESSIAQGFYQKTEKENYPYFANWVSIIIAPQTPPPKLM